MPKVCAPRGSLVQKAPRILQGGQRGAGCRPSDRAFRLLDVEAAPVSPIAGDRTTFRADLQGLRAVAVALVMLDHAGVSQLAGGYVGVDVFFVLSGFLITGLLLREARDSRRISLLEFYARRARRILPAAVLTIVSTTVVAYELLNYVRARSVAWDSVWAAVFAANFHFARAGADYFAQGQPPSPIQHYWSLAVEEQFYLVWPAVLSLTLFAPALLRRRRAVRHAPAGLRALLVICVVGVASFVWSLHATRVSPVGAYYSPFTRAWELALGAALAVGATAGIELPLRAAAGWIGSAMIALAAVTLSGATPYPGDAALLPAVGAALIIAAELGGRPRLAVGHLLAVRPMQYIGDRSYALYLWHWPVLVLAMLYERRQLETKVNLLLLLVALLLSIVSYRTVENPIRRARWSPRLSTALAPVAIATAVAVALLTVSSLDSRIGRVSQAAAAVPKSMAATGRLVTAAPRAKALPALVEAVKAALTGASVPADLTPPVGQLLHDAFQAPSGCDPSQGDPTTQPICHLGDPKSFNTIVVIGDSHALMWIPAILPMAKADAWNVVPLIRKGCEVPKWIGNGYPSDPTSDIASCHAWYRWARRQTQRLRPDVVVIAGCCSGANGPIATTMRNTYAATAAALRRFARNVIVLEDQEETAAEPVDCLLAPGATLRSCMTTQTSDDLSFNNGLARLAAAGHFDFLKTRGWFCYRNRCPMVVGTTIVYQDRNHITNEYAQRLAGQFRAAFRECLFATCPK
jgi:peptidoglycan/LPS O-acetylase OafA/YrhL